MARYYFILFHLYSLYALYVRSAETNDDICESIDGDCPKCDFPLIRGLNPVAEVKLSNESRLVASATSAETFLDKLSPSHVQRFDDPKTGLHTSLFYFCCHSLAEILKMKDALREMSWTSFLIEYDTFGCNLDHDGQTVYLHAMPRNQTALFEWAKQVEITLREHNVTVHHPRKSLFHMTLARVDPEYPVESAVGHLNSTYFGSHRLCSFEFYGETFHARDCNKKKRM